MAKERKDGQEGHVVTVSSQEGQSVLVTVPMVGFPEGFQLPPGARVVLVSTPSGPAVRPLVRAVPGSVPPGALEQRGTPIPGGGRRVLQDATEVGKQPAQGSPGEDVMWVVESSDPEGPEPVIAVRRANSERN